MHFYCYIYTTHMIQIRDIGRISGVLWTRHINRYTKSISKYSPLSTVALREYAVNISKVGGRGRIIEIMSYIGYLIEGMILAYITRKYILYIGITKGASMHPTISEGGGKVIIRSMEMHSMEWKKRHIKHGDIVIVEHPFKGKNVRLCKRVIALEGESVSMQGKYRYNRYMGGREGGSCTVPLGHLWIEGDNKDKSYDSRSFGPVSIVLVVGTLLTLIPHI